MINAEAVTVSGQQLIRWREIEWELLPLDDPSARHLDDRQLFRWQGKTVLFRSDADGTEKINTFTLRTALPASKNFSHPKPRSLSQACRRAATATVQSPCKLAHQKTFAGRNTLADRLLFRGSAGLRVLCRE